MAIYDEEERKILNQLDFPRELQTLGLLVQFMDPDKLDTTRLPLDRIFEGTPDELDRMKFTKVVTRLTNKGILRNCLIGDDAISFEIVPAARSLVRKLVLQAGKKPKNSRGILCARAFLALKRAMGMSEDAWYLENFVSENFNFGEDISYLDMGFKGDRWRMEVHNSASRHLERTLLLSPAPSGQLMIYLQTRYALPDCDEMDCKVLGKVSIEDFTNPDIWREIIPGLVASAQEELENAKAKLKSLIEVRTEKGQYVNKLDLLHDMEAVCAKDGWLNGIFGSSPKARPIPEWPVDCERHGFFRALEFGLGHFENEFLKRVPKCEWFVNEFKAEIWLRLFKDASGIDADWLDLEDYGADACAADLRENFPDMAARIGGDYADLLIRSKIRIAWGLYTKDFIRFRAFVNAILECGPMEKSKELELGWAFTDNVDSASLLDCLKEAVEQSLTN